MTRPSPYDLIQEASRNAGAADRWAALQANTQSRVAVPQQGEPPFSAAQGAAESAPPVRPASHPELIDPPFPPPQPRHAALDDIAQRHEQARRTASRPVEWKQNDS